PGKGWGIKSQVRGDGWLKALRRVRDASNDWPWCPSAVIAASATAMSCSTVPALAPTAPTMVPSKTTGTPPPKMTTFPALLSWMPKSGFPDCASVARDAVVLSKILAVAALPMARSTLPISAPSWRWNATRLPPASTTATQYGMPKLAALASAADNICLASSSVRLVNVRGMTESSGVFDPDGLRVHKGVRPEVRELAT